MNVLILDLANTSTLLHESISNYSNSKKIDIGLIYFNKTKYTKSNLKFKEYIDFTKALDENEVEIVDKIIHEIENKYNFTFNAALYLDRYRNNDNIFTNYYKSYLYQIHKIIHTHKPKIIIGEVALGFEILTSYYTDLLNINYLVPSNIYAFQKPRLTFFDRYYSSKYINIIAENSTKKVSSQIIESLKDERIKVDINAGIGKSLQDFINIKTFTRLKYNIQNKDNSDHRENLYRKAIVRLTNQFNKTINKVYFKNVSVDYTEINKFILMPLHIQPEATPDSIATNVSNQYELARQIALALPYGYKLLIKEHPNNFGCRNIRELQKYNNLPNTHFVNLNSNMKDVILNSSLVIAIGGNAALESALYKRKAIVLSKVYFSELPSIRRIDNYAQISEAIKSTLQTDIKENDWNTFYQHIYNGSFNAVWHQPLMADGIIDESNIKACYDAISQTLNAINSEANQNEG